MVDADQHYYETDDCFTRYLDPSFRNRTVEIVTAEGKAPRPYLAGRPSKFFPANPCHLIGRPGALFEYFETGGGKGAGLTHGGAITAEDLPESRNRVARLALMDAQQVEAALMFPTLAVGIEYELVTDAPELVGPNFTSFNRWLQDEWGFGADGRIFGVPLLSLHDLDWATAELDRVLAEGAHVAHLRPGPVLGKWSPADPRFDPFWARAEEAGIPVAFHLSDSGLCEQYTTMWGESARPPLNHFSPFQRLTAFGERIIHDTMAALISHNLFGRFPDLTVMSIENGCEWVGPLLKKLDRAARMCGPGDWPFGDPGRRPRDIFIDHVKVAPYPEDDVAGLVQLVGQDAVVAGSDWPHPEGLPQPLDFSERLIELDQAATQRIMRDNTAELLGIG